MVWKIKYRGGEAAGSAALSAEEYLSDFGFLNQIAS